MIRTFVLAAAALNLFVACASNQPYQPLPKPEDSEFAGARLDVYPDDIRKATTPYSGAPVAWAGVIRESDARDADSVTNNIVVDTVFEHHYFDWVEDKNGHHVKLSISPRGEGAFRARWYLTKVGRDASFKSAQDYSAPGKLAIVYGVPESVDPDGTIVLKYRYLRVFDQDQFSTNNYDYGRLGEPLHTIQNGSKNSSTPTK